MTNTEQSPIGSVHATHSTRDIRFDILKVLGLFCIILAHTQPPAFIFQLRNFDVPLMVMISGTLFYLTTGKKEFSSWAYLRKRVPRLVAPVWLFLAFFFTAFYLLFLVVQHPYPYSFEAISGSFLFRGGIGYVYIIRIFLIIAIASPFILKLYKFLGSETQFLGILAISYVIYEIIFNFLIKDVNLSPPWVAIFIKQYLIICIPYGCLVGLGIVLTKLNKQFLLALVFASFATFASIFIHLFFLAHKLGRPAAELVQTQTYKYPPTIYYLSYAIFAAILAYLMVDDLMQKYGNRLMEQENLVDALVFVSTSSLWSYLWHIFWLTIWNLLRYVHLPLIENFAVKFFAVSFFAIATTYLQKRLATKLIKSNPFCLQFSHLLNILFLK
ncbi:MAG: hypothetical protein KME16_12810 [Scytolyngbya sp. HA4215-MV1]|nr:hypothetical protein [Scytolyngbya sp. HA4215-MV1]